MKILSLKKAKTEEFLNRFLNENKNATSNTFFEGVHLKNEENGSHVKLHLEIKDLQKIQEICNGSDILIYNFYCCALSILLHKYEETSLFISPLSQFEEYAESHNQLFVLQHQLDKAENFKSLFSASKDTLLESLDNNFDLEIFKDSFLNFEDFKNKISFGITIKETSSDIRNIVKTLFVFDFKSNLPSLEIICKGEIIDNELLYIFGDNFNKLLNETLQNLYEPISNLEFKGDKEQSVLNQVNQWETNFSLDKNIVELLVEQCENQSDKIAISNNNQTITYKQLDQQTNKLARYIQNEFSAGEDDLFGIMLSRSINMVSGIFSVWKTGSAYVPVATNLGDDALQHIIENSNLKAVITDDANVVKQLRGLSIEIPVIDLNAIDQFIKDLSDLPLSVIIGAEDLAYVIYTSGSTGKPKGAMIEHYGMLNHILAKITEMGINQDSVVAQNAPHTFDISVWQFFAPLVAGGTSIIYDENTILEINEFVTCIAENKVTLLELVPSYLLEMLNYIEGEDEKVALTLDILILNAETLTKGMVKRWLDAYANIPIVNTYGATEVSDDMSHFIMHDVPKSYSVPVMKQPIQNFEVHILDGNRKRVPVGVKGEIYLASPCVGRGYFNDEKRTKEAFLKGPIEGITKQERIYKTGDLGRYMPNGTMEFIGRNDNQVKILGHRIELDAIENITAEVKGVKSVKAIAHTDKQMIVLYYVSDSEINKAFMEEQLLKKLPKYMIPSAFIHMSSFPLTKNGKIDKNQLPTVTLEDLATKEYVAPQNETEEKLAVIWQEVLKVDKIGTTDNFFELGGHSLLAVRTINRIKKELGLNTSVKTFFENPTILSLSNQLKEAQYIPIEKLALQNSYPLTASQRRFWVLSQVGDAALAYNLSMPLKFKGELDVLKLEESFSFLINRHEALRTSFKLDENGQARQFITSMDDLDFSLNYNDFSLNTDKETAIEAYLVKENAISFNLEKAPLLRVSVIKSGDQEYVFFMTMHHIIGDGWSSVVLYREMVTIYNSLVQSEEVNLPELRIQYKDYAGWLSQEAQQQHYKTSETYWLNQFSGSLPVMELPGFNKRPLVKTYNGKYLSYEFSKEFAEKLTAFSQKNDVTLFMTLMSGVNALLNRYTGQQDIIIGSPIAGREHSDLENQIGIYINTLAFRTQIYKDFNFLDLLSHQKEVILSGYEHQGYPFDELVDKLELKRDSSRSALFDIMVVLQSQSKLNTSNNDKLIGLEINEQEVIHKKAQFDLIFAFMETESLLFGIEYNTDIYDKIFIEKIFVHFERLLSILIDEPEKEIQAADYLSEEEKNLILFDFNDDKVEYPEYKTIVDLFEEQVLKTPDNIALVFEGKKLTYRELNEQANQLGNYLADKYDIQPDDLLGIKLERSEQLIVSILGVLKSGGAYVPIDPSYPESRKEYIEKDSNCKVIIDENELENFYSEKNNYLNVNVNKKISPDNLAYVIYTSGTTGNPKGSLLEHKNVVRLFFTDKPLFDFNENDVWTMFHSYSFDFSVWEIYGALLYGGKLIVIPKALAQNTPEFLELVYNESVTVLNQTPPAFYNFIECDKLCQKRDVKLRYVIFGGEALNPVMLSSWFNKYPEPKLINMYGITETTVHVTYKEIGKNEIDLGQSNIGKPIPTLSCLILDEFKNIVPVGVIGEIHVGGSGLARGYLNRPDLTEEKFISNPFKTEGRLYKTGDLGRWLPDGNIEYIGRKDNQVKIRGHRIELGEIETVLLSYSSEIKQFVVDVCDVNGNEYLVAYYVSDVDVDKSSLRHYLQQRLPDYMVPNFFVAMDAIPLTGNGKVDRKLLPNVEENDLIKTEYVAPRSEEEKVLASVWSDILKYEKIGVKDSFYNLGGDSIKSILIISRLRQLGYTLKIDQILRNPVLEDLARFIVVTTNVIDQKEVEGEAALTPIQRYFFESETIPNKNYYNQAVILKSKEALEPSVLNSSIDSLVTHHDALRMVYKHIDNRWSQFNKNTSGIHYKINFYDLTEDADELTALNTIGNELQSTFDIGSGDLFHVGHFRMSDGDRLVLIIHHLVIDGVSWRILLEDLSNLYSSYKSENEAKLPAKTDSFKRWASLQKDFAKGKEMQAERGYWEEISKESIPQLSSDYNPESTTVTIDKRSGFLLDKTLTDKLQTQVHNIYNTEINDVLLTGLGLAIQEVFDVSKTAVKMEGHGREEIIDGVDIGRTVGWFTSIYPFILDVSGDHALVSVKESLRKIPNKGIGYGILNYLDTPFESSLVPSIQFNYLGDFGSNAGGSGDEGIFEFTSENMGSSVDVNNSQSTILLDISGMMVAGELNISIGYSGEKYSKETIDKLMYVYENKLRELITEVSEIKQSQLSPSDLTYRNLSFEELLQINKDNNVEDIYELSPLQQGLYYHWLIDNSSHMYFEQMSYSLNAEGLSIESVKKAFNELISRYSVLRTAFRNNLSELPLQVVYKSVEGNFSYEKITKNENETIEDWIERKKTEDREIGFDFEEPSLMRLKVLELEAGQYIFMWSHHHILMDGWCMSILINDFGNILQSISTDKLINLPNPIKYSEYIKWLSKVDKEESLEYWKNYLDGLETIIDIPLKKEQSTKFEVKHWNFEIKDELYQKVTQLCQEIGITPNTFMQGAWGYLLSRYNNTQDVVFGSVVSGRPGELSGVEDMVGLFINTIPVRLQYINDDTPKSLLKQIQSEAIKSVSHHYMNLSDVQSQSTLGGEMIKNLMVFENYFVKEANENSVEEQDKQRISVEEVKTFEQTNYDFTIIVNPSNVELKVDFSYNSGVFDEESIETLSHHFLKIVEQFTKDDEVKLGEIDYVTEEEKQKILFDFNDTGLEFPKDKTIIELFEEQVKETPDNIAISFNDCNLTYRKLDDLVGKMSNFLLTNLQIERGELVAIKLERSEYLIVSILAVLKTGAAYVPVDINYPENRINTILDETKARLIIDEQFISDFNNAKETLPTQVPTIERSSEDLAYVIYTSGSTGVPKGVMITNKSLVNLCFWHNDVYEVSAQSRGTLFAGVAFDASVWEIFPYLISGAALFPIQKDEVRFQLDNLIAFLKTNQITHSYIPSKICQDLIEENVYGLETKLLTGGEALVYSKESDLKIYNNYGPTENTVVATYYDCQSKFNKNIPIGKPISNVQVYILNNELNVQPIGVIGELCISGDGISTGYWNNIALTNEKFIENPFLSGQKMYKTGDLARWLPDGNIQFIGRVDGQVKIRGFRIELGEIEKHLSSQEGVKQSVVIVKEIKGEKYLVAYYVSEVELDKRELPANLSKILPDYMIPSYYVQLDSIPLTTNDKVDRKSLPDVEEYDIIREEYVAPGTSEELRVFEIWNRVLDIDKIGVNDNFFALGGNSIKAMMIIGGINKMLDAKIDLEVFFYNPTIKAIAQEISNKTWYEHQLNEENISDKIII
ncbi:amino acid adenylation domain-containing protein [Flavobacterium sp. DSR2-3-3]|uniref:amino acid adenylation domain-containing protein n=1 Tax=Flavobacterium sp. DSR2-3-3 TaxID=2804632 RepID=UPI003CED3285